MLYQAGHYEEDLSIVACCEEMLVVVSFVREANTGDILVRLVRRALEGQIDVQGLGAKGVGLKKVR